MSAIYSQTFIGFSPFGPTGAIMGTHALAARSLAISIACVLWRVLMILWAVSLNCISCRQSLSPQQIFSSGNRFEVFRIAALDIAAQMVQVESSGYRPPEMLIGNTMNIIHSRCLSASATNIENAVPISQCTSPLPAAGHCLDGYVAKKEDQLMLSHGFRIFAQSRSRSSGRNLMKMEDL